MSVPFFGQRDRTNVQTVTIAASGDTSGAILAGPANGLAVLFPAAFTGTKVSLLGSTDSGGTFVPLVDKAGAAIEITFTASSWGALAPGLVTLPPYLKLKSNGTEAASRSLTVFLRDC